MPPAAAARHPSSPAHLIEPAPSEASTCPPLLQQLPAWATHCSSNRRTTPLGIQQSRCISSNHHPAPVTSSTPAFCCPSHLRCFILFLQHINIIETMQPLWRSLCVIQRCVFSARSVPLQVSKVLYSISSYGLSDLECNLLSWRGMSTNVLQYSINAAKHNESRFLVYRELSALPSRITLPTTTGISFPIRHLSTDSQPKTVIVDRSVASTDTVQPQRIKFKRLDKTARHIMNILDKEEVEKVRGSRDIPDIKLGYIVQLKVGIVIARQNAGFTDNIQTTENGSWCWSGICFTFILTKHQGNESVRQEGCEEGKALLPEG